MADPEPIVDTPVRPLLWTKRLCLLVVLISLLVLSTRLVWGWRSAQRLAEVDRRIVELGGKARIEDYNPTSSLPDDRNAAKLVLAAAALLNPAIESPSMSNAEFDSRRVPPEPLWFSFAEKAYASNGPAVQMLKGLRDLPEADWGTRWQAGTFSFLPRQLNKVRAVGGEAADAALLLHFQGDDAEAFALLESVLDLGRAARADPSFVCQLVGVGVDHLAIDRLMTAAPAARVAESDSDSRGVQRAVVERLIARLLDDGAAQSSFERTLLFEQRQVLDLRNLWAPAGWMLRPLAEDALADYLDDGDAAFRRSRAGDWPDEEARRRSAKAPRPERDEYRPAGWTFLGYSTNETVTHNEGRYRLERRFAAISLAVMLYRHDHGGAFPQSLDQLVPRYLPAVPVDVCSADRRPIGYRIEKTPDGAPRPMVFSPSGSESPRPYPHLRYDYHVFDGTDRPVALMDNIGQWRDLSRWADATPGWKEWQDPTTQPGYRSEFGGFASFGEFGPPPGEPPATGPTTGPATAPTP